jgi:hypothetical protein
MGSPCAGKATCGLCRVKIVGGAALLSPFNADERKHLGNVYFITKQRLSCQARPCPGGCCPVMTSIFRFVVSAIVIVATYYFIYWTTLAFIPIHWGVAAVISYACAMAAGWYFDPHRLSGLVTGAEHTGRW